MEQAILFPVKLYWLSGGEGLKRWLAASFVPFWAEAAQQNKKAASRARAKL